MIAAMAEIINLRQARKSKQRKDAADAAATNRAKHSVTKAQRALAAGEAARTDRLLDGAKRETD
ncbi:DUF4169 family protein [Novosphingobium colocasiae]|uniref:DUF4169 family protein n=2 Tax=Novosphingobium colocasiae TaxID=1256513 RepID=A0A918UDR0_9SPHN|nr:hypothetical protein GCM10011614_06410 [Novosphingobium colocasiae]